MAITTLDKKDIGSIIKFKVDGVPLDWIVLHHGRPSELYDTSFEGGTILLMKDIYENREWHSSNVNNYANSTIHSYLNNQFFGLIEDVIKNEVVQVKIPYCEMKAGSAPIHGGDEGAPAYVWLLGGREINWTAQTNRYSPSDGTTLSYFAGTEAIAPERIAYLNGTATKWWLRSPMNNGATDVWITSYNGGGVNTKCLDSAGVRPAMVLPSSLLINDAGEIIFNQPPTQPPSVTVPDMIYSGRTARIEWGTSTDPENDPITYVLERSHTDGGGGYIQNEIYSGPLCTYDDMITDEMVTVTYRVKAQDSHGNESAYILSETRTVSHNTPPEISGTDEDLGTKTAPFTYTYTVSDYEDSSVSVVEAVDSVTIKTHTALYQVPYDVVITGDVWAALAKGLHTLTITATDSNGGTAVRTLIFDKQSDYLFAELGTDKIQAFDTRPTRMTVQVTREVPVGASLKAEVCNNGFDTAPSWEDATAAVIYGHAHVFRNTVKASAKWGVNIRVRIKRNNALGNCRLYGIGGNVETV